MALPRKLKNFNLFIDGLSYVGQVTEVSLPKLGRKMEEFRCGGMNGPVKADMGMQALELDFTVGLNVEIFRTFGVTKADGVLLRFAGAWQREDSAQVDAVEVVARGRHEEINQDNAKAGDDAPTKVKSALSYYKLTVNGVVEIEIDLMNFVENVGGTDRLAEQRAAIGL
jgi:Bacteriophage tail tube protein